MLKDKVYNNNPHNDNNMKGSTQNLFSSISAKDLQCVKYAFAAYVHLHVVHNRSNLILNAKYYTNSLKYF